MMKRPHPSDHDNDSFINHRSDRWEEYEIDDEQAQADANLSGRSGAPANGSTTRIPSPTHETVTRATSAPSASTSADPNVTTAKASSHSELRLERRRETNRLSKQRCRGQKREMISRCQEQIHSLSEEFKRLTEEKEKLQKELIDCLLEQQHDQDANQDDNARGDEEIVTSNDGRKLDAIGESLALSAVAASVACSLDKDDAKPPPSMPPSSSSSSLLIAPASSLSYAAAGQPKNFHSTRPVDEWRRTGDISRLSLRNAQQEVHHDAVGAGSVNILLAPNQSFNFILTSGPINTRDNSLYNAGVGLPFPSLDSSHNEIATALATRTSGVAAAAELPSPLMATPASVPLYFPPPAPATSSGMDAFLLLRSVLQNSANIGSLITTGSNINNPPLLPPSSYMTITPVNAHTDPARSSFNQTAMIVPQASSAMNLLIQQHRRHQEEQELLVRLLSGHQPSPSGNQSSDDSQVE